MSRGMKTIRLIAVGATMIGVLATWLAPALAATDAGICAWAPITDVPRAQLLLRNWAEAAKLPAFDKDRSGLSIDRSASRLTLQFSPGTLTLSWRLDASCDPSEVTILASAEYAGPVPDETEVKRLVTSFRTVTTELRGPAAWRAALDRLRQQRLADPRVHLAI